VRRENRLGLLLALGALAVGFIVELVIILTTNSGRFTYTLDDPYIHLALAERIHEGHYGINAGEPSAPSSSILWPFLLAPFARAAGFEYLPLAIGFIAAAATVVVYHKILVESVLVELRRRRSIIISVLLVCLALTTNLIGLPFTGLEHSLQVMLASFVALGLFREARTGEVRPWLIAAIAAGPLIRYESLAISTAAVLYLFLRGHRRSSFMAAILTLAPILLFSAFLAHLGLNLLPTSVLVKAPMFSSAHLVPEILSNLRTTLRDPTGVLLAVAGLWMLGIVLFSARDAAEKAVAGSVALAVALHAMAGRYGAYHRWELYIVSFVLLTLLFLERRAISEGVRSRSTALVTGIAGLWCVVLGGRYIFGLATLPLAANNIYEQQYQMHRFVVAFERRAVAVNDLGFVSFGNRYYKLDLLGLGSPSLLAKPDRVSMSEWLEQNVPRHGIETAMLYEEWFEDLPQAWRKVGELRLSRPRITPAWDRVSFYATDEAAYPSVRERVNAFRMSLPPGVQFDFAK
jgi:hypothetical protein